METTAVVLVGLGGYGTNYVSALLDYEGEPSYTLVGAVDPAPENCHRLAELKARNVPVFSDMDAFYAASQADLAVISSPIQFHAEQICTALDHGSHVLCAKPMCAAVQDGLAIISARDRAERCVTIGYPWSHTDPIQQLKRDYLAGLFGQPLRLKTLVLWPRDRSYYARSRWAGQKKDEQGRWVLDSVANNAAAHYLHNMFYVLGETIDSSLMPEQVTTELYRANPIENYDSAATRIATAGPELLYLATHATKERVNPSFCYEFEKATVLYGPFEGSDKNIVARFADGTQKDYGDPFGERLNQLWLALATVQGREQIVCGPEAALAQTLCINGMQEAGISEIDAPRVHLDSETDVVWVDGLAETLKECYRQWKLPAELGADWACRGRSLSLTDYRCFPKQTLEG